MAATGESLSFKSFEHFDLVDYDMVEKLLNADASEGLARPRCSIAGCDEDEGCLLHLTLSRESTEPPSEHEDFEKDDFDDACDVSWSLRSVGKINVSSAHKFTLEVENDSDDLVPEEPLVENWEYTREVSNLNDQCYDHILVRNIVDERKSHWKYFEDATWQKFDPAFAQWLAHRNPLSPILEDLFEDVQDEEPPRTFCMSAYCRLACQATPCSTGGSFNQQI